MASSVSATAVDRHSPEPSETSTLHDPPRLSLSTDDGHSVNLSPESQENRVPSPSPHLLPPVAFPSESLSESLNLSDSQNSLRHSRRMSTASKRMSYITELRSKRDRSDTASLMTVDEITAEVESRQENAAKSGDSDEWTKVDIADDHQSIKGEDEDEYAEEDEEYEEGEEEEGEETATDEDEPGKAIMSRGNGGLLHTNLARTNSLRRHRREDNKMDQGRAHRRGIIREGLPGHGRCVGSAHGRQTSRATHRLGPERRA